MLVRCLACPADGFCGRCGQASSPESVEAFQARLIDLDLPEHDCPACSGRTTNPVHCSACIQAGYEALTLF